MEEEALYRVVCQLPNTYAYVVASRRSKAAAEKLVELLDSHKRRGATGSCPGPHAVEQEETP